MGFYAYVAGGQTAAQVSLQHFGFVAEIVHSVVADVVVCCIVFLLIVGGVVIEGMVWRVRRLL